MFFVKNVTLKMWILVKLRFWKCEFVKNENLKTWILWKIRFWRREFLDKLRVSVLDLVWYLFVLIWPEKSLSCSWAIMCSQVCMGWYHIGIICTKEIGVIHCTWFACAVIDWVNNEHTTKASKGEQEGKCTAQTKCNTEDTLIHIHLSLD